MSQLENVNCEEWRTIKDFPNYQVSSLGRIKNIKTNRILKPFKNKTSGYYYIHIINSRERKCYRVHRLVATYFINNPLNLSDVNHIDENKCNNTSSNLEWVSHLDNIRHGSGIKRSKASRSKPVICSNGNTYNSISEAGALLHVSNGSICEVLKGKHNHVGGYTFKYKEE
jgi:hypothetical protein